eukprot:g49941.t1
MVATATAVPTTVRKSRSVLCKEL